MSKGANLDGMEKGISDTPKSTGSLQTCSKETVWIKLAVRDYGLRLLKRRPYKLVAGGRTYEGNTGDDALIKLELPASAKTGVLEVWARPEEQSQVFEVEIGGMDPIALDSGVIARLDNLGFFPVKTPETLSKEAVAAFQRFVGIEETGIFDKATRGVLEKAYDVDPEKSIPQSPLVGKIIDLDVTTYVPD